MCAVEVCVIYTFTLLGADMMYVCHMAVAVILLSLIHIYGFNVVVPVAIWCIVLYILVIITAIIWEKKIVEV